MKTTEGERLSEILDLVKIVSQDKRIKNRVGIRILIGNSGGFDPEFVIYFNGPYFKAKFEVEMSFFAGSGDYEAILTIFVVNLTLDNISEPENVYLRQMTDVKPYFEKIAHLFE